MTITAPWLALAADWMDSPMFKPLAEHGVSEPATMGERLAWVYLLCHAKIKGRGGKVTVRKNDFATTYDLSVRAVEGMLFRAQKCAAIDINGDVVSLCNWRLYQDKAFKAKALDYHESGKSGATHHQPPTTNHPKGASGVPDASPRRPPVEWSEESGWSGITEGDRAEWGTAYPACNLDRQLAEMHAWLVANPAKAKKSNWRRFVNNWLNAEQDKGGDLRGVSNDPARIRNSAPASAGTAAASTAAPANKRPGRY